MFDVKIDGKDIVFAVAFVVLAVLIGLDKLPGEVLIPLVPAAYLARSPIPAKDPS